MKCARCGTTNSAGAAFCNQCGSPLAPVGPSVAPAAPAASSAAPALVGAFDAQQKRNTAIATGAGIVGLIAAGVLGAGAMGLLKLPGQLSGGDQLKLAGKGGGTPMLPVVAPAAKGMPDDVKAWLDHLAETEKRKQDLTTKQLSEFSAMATEMQTGVGSAAQVQQLEDPDAPSKTTTPQNDSFQDLVSNAKPAWYQLNDFFLSVKAPDECVAIQQSYSRGLSQMGDQMGDLAGIVNGVNPMSTSVRDDAAKSEEQARDIGKDHPKSIDASFQGALDGVDKECGKYGVKRWFDIDVHGGSAGSFGSFTGF